MKDLNNKIQDLEQQYREAINKDQINQTQIQQLKFKENELFNQNKRLSKIVARQSIIQQEIQSSILQQKRQSKIYKKKDDREEKFLDEINRLLQDQMNLSLQSQFQELMDSYNDFSNNLKSHKNKKKNSILKGRNSVLSRSLENLKKSKSFDDIIEENSLDSSSSMDSSQLAMSKNSDKEIVINNIPTEQKKEQEDEIIEKKNEQSQMNQQLTRIKKKSVIDVGKSQQQNLGFAQKSGNQMNEMRELQGNLDLMKKSEILLNQTLPIFKQKKVVQIELKDQKINDQDHKSKQLFQSSLNQSFDLDDVKTYNPHQEFQNRPKSKSQHNKLQKLVKGENDNQNEGKNQIFTAFQSSQTHPNKFNIIKKKKSTQVMNEFPILYQNASEYYSKGKKN